MPSNLARTSRRGVFTNGFSFYVQDVDRKWKRFRMFDDAVAYQDKLHPPPDPRAQRERQARRDRQPGWIYFVSPVGGGLIKVGFSRVSPESRLLGLQCGSPVPLEIIGRRRGVHADEQLLHYRLRDFRRHGEWFEPSEEVLHEVGLTEEEAAAELLAERRARLRGH